MPTKRRRRIGQTFLYQSIQDKIVEFLQENKYATIKMLHQRYPYIDIVAIKYGLSLLRKQLKVEEAYTLC